MNEDKLGKVLKTATIVLVGLTAAMNILGGAGTTCAAFLTKQYPPMWSLMDYQWLYQALVIVTVGIGLAGVWTTISLARGGEKAFRNTLIVLVLGTVVGAIHVFASLALRGKAVPANVKLYLNMLTLLVAVLLLLPGIRQRVDFSRKADGIDRQTTGGLAAILAGVLMLTTPYWAGPSHTFQGSNWVYVLETPLYLTGGLLTLGGMALLVRVAIDIYRQEKWAKEPV